MKLNFTIPKFIRFGIVGLINTIIDLGVLNFLVLVFGLTEPLLFSFFKGVSFICALLNSYFMNKNFTFEVKENNKKTFYLFVFYSLMGFMVNVLSSSFIYYLLSSNYELSVHAIATISGLFGTFLGLAVNYFAYNFLVFK